MIRRATMDILTIGEVLIDLTQTGKDEKLSLIHI